MTENDLVDTLYRVYAVPLLGFVRHQSARRGISESLVDAEGVVQEAFAAILRSRDTIRNPRAWLFAVAARLVGKCAVEHRRRHAGDVPDDLVDGGAAQWSSLPPRADTDDICEARWVLEDIAEQRNHQMVAVYLHHVQGWTAKEIGEYLGCAESTAGVHIHRGIKRLRRENQGSARRRRLRTLGKIGLAVCIGVFVLRELIRSWTSRSAPGCFHAHPPTCPPPPDPPPPSAAPGAPDFTALFHPVVLAVLAVVALCAMAVALAMRRRRPCDSTGARQEDPVDPKDPTNN